MAIPDQIGEFMKVYTLIISLFVLYSGIVEFSPERAHTDAEVLIWLILAATGIFGLLALSIVDALEV